jgi:hypothetical protein
MPPPLEASSWKFQLSLYKPDANSRGIRHRPLPTLQKPRELHEKTEGRHTKTPLFEIFPLFASPQTNASK